MDALTKPDGSRSRSETRPAWRRWLIDVERGLSQSFRGESTLFGYCFVASIILTMGIVLRINVLNWAVVLLALSVAAAAEMFQMVLHALGTDLSEHLGKETRKALRIGSAAVVVTRLGAISAVVIIYGAIIVKIL